MRITHSHPLTVLVLAGSLLAATGAASADTLVTDFNDFSLTGTYGSWAAGTLTSGPDSFGVQATSFGGGFLELDPNVDATGETTIELDVTINDADPELGLGIILVLVDEDLTQFDYGQTTAMSPEFPGWFGLMPGETYTLTASIADDWYTISGFGDDGVLDLSDLGHFHIQIDVGLGQSNYDVEFNNLSLTTGPTVPGDADGDGDVDLDDYNIMSGNMYTATGNGASDGDFNDDGFVDFEDFVTQALNFGDWPAAEENVGTLPEPTTLAIIGLGAGLAILRRRSRH